MLVMPFATGGLSNGCTDNSTNRRVARIFRGGCVRQEPGPNNFKLLSDTLCFFRRHIG